jgi:hypothetical protein
MTPIVLYREVAISPQEPHIAAMYEDREGEFAYTIQKHRLGGSKAGWTWHVHHIPSGHLVDAGSSLRSHDHAKTAAFKAIWSAELKTYPSLPVG